MCPQKTASPCARMLGMHDDAPVSLPSFIIQPHTIGTTILVRDDISCIIKLTTRGTTV